MGIFRAVACAAMLAATSLASPARALDEIPAYAVTEIGSALIAAYSGVTYSTATAVNESGDAVGWAIVNGDMRAFIYTAESGAELLPLFPGYIAGQAVDICRPRTGQRPIRVHFPGTGLTMLHQQETHRGFLPSN